MTPSVSARSCGLKRRHDGLPVGLSTRSKWPLPPELTAHIIDFAEDRDVMQLRGVSQDMKRMVEDAHAWRRRVEARGWMLPAHESDWAKSDMLAYYRAYAEITETPLHEPQRAHLDASTPGDVSAATKRFPGTLPVLRLSSGPSAEVTLALTTLYPHLRSMFVRFHGAKFTKASIRALSGFAALVAVDIGACNTHLTKSRLEALVSAVPQLRMLALRGASSLEGPNLASLAAATHLESLVLEDCDGVGSIPPELKSLVALKSLDLSVWSRRPLLGQALIGEIVDTFPRLESLDLWGRRLRGRDANLLVPLGQLPLKTLNIGHMGVRGLPAQLCRPQLEDLSVSRNKWFRFPPETQNMTGLKRLDFSSTNHRAFPRVVLTLWSLEYLDASWNKGMTLTHSMAQLTNLRELQLTDCRFQTFPQALCTAPKLERLRMEGSDLRRIPLRVGEMQTLTHLDLGGTAIWDAIPRAVAHLDNLTWLVLPKVTHRAQPHFASMFPRLRYLRLGSIDTAAGSPRRLDRRRGMSVDDLGVALEGCRELRGVALDTAPWLAEGSGLAGVRARALNSFNFDGTYDR